MGYTHYWDSQPGEYDSVAFSAFVDHVRKVLDATTVAVAGPDGNGKPEITNELVAFNGAADESCEALHITRVVVAEDDPSLVFNFCKTDWQPYDSIVTATLLLYRHQFPESIKLSSDGEPEEWENGRVLAQTACGFSPEIALSES